MQDYLETLGVHCSQECAAAIAELLPIEWMDICTELYKTDMEFRRHVVFYISDGMMSLYRRERKNRLTVDDFNYIQRLNDIIMNGPRPEKSFTVFRGLFSNPETKQGEVIVQTTPKSASFDLQVIRDNYALSEVFPNVYGYVTSIEVPKGLPCLYNNSENQVIFPSGARFEIIEGEHVTSWRIDGETNNLVGYRWRYLGV